MFARQSIQMLSSCLKYGQVQAFNENGYSSGLTVVVSGFKTNCLSPSLFVSLHVYFSWSFTYWRWRSHPDRWTVCTQKRAAKIDTGKSLALLRAVSEIHFQ